MTEKISKKEKLIKQKEKIERQIKDIEEMEKLNDFVEVKHNKKVFRIYKWENKLIKNFVYPKGFKMSEFQEFNELIESKKFKLEVCKYYFTKHYNKLQWNKEYCLSGFYLIWFSYLYSLFDDLVDSYGDGRVVCVKEDKKIK